MRIRTANANRRRRDRGAAIRHWMTLLDNCEICLGAKGGVRGNENRIRGVVVCDCCHYDSTVDVEAARRISEVAKRKADGA